MDNIVSKVKNLLALSRSENLEQATISAVIVNKIILQHHIFSEYDGEMFDDEQPVYTTSRISGWKSRLLCMIAHHYGVAVWNDKIHKSESNRSISRFRLVGLYNDVQLVRQMFAWLTHQVKHFADQDCQGMGMVSINSYCVGAVVGIEIAFKQARNLVMASPYGAKLRAREKQAQEYLCRKHGLVVGGAKRRFDDEAFRRGNQAGSYIGTLISPSVKGRVDPTK